MMQTADTYKSPWLAELRRRLGLTYRGGATSYLFVLPSILFISVFVIVPIVGAFYYSFNDYDLLTAPEFEGLKNYRLLAKEPRLFPAIRGARHIPVAVTGVSCRQQIGHFTEAQPRHVVEYLAAALK